MGPTYYQIELSARMLTTLLVVLALLLVLAFVFGYGAAWSVLRTPAQQPVTVTDTNTPTPTAQAVPTRVLQRPTQTPTRVAARPTPTPRPRPTATRRPQPLPTAVPTAATGAYWVQVLAVARRDAVEQAQTEIERLKGGGFPRSNQQVIRSRVAGGGSLYKLRIGPFPDHESASRVARRMRGSGIPDAWVLQQ